MKKKYWGSRGSPMSSRRFANGRVGRVTIELWRLGSYALK